MYKVYVLRCKDNSLYTGVALDPLKRFREHQEKGAKGARYTHAHEAVRLEIVFAADTKQNAYKLEARIKQLSHSQKEALIADPTLLGSLVPLDPACFTVWEEK